MSATRPGSPPPATRPAAVVYARSARAAGVTGAACLLALAACRSDPVPQPRPRLGGPERSARAPDPDAGRTAAQLPGWAAIDRAVAAGALEHVVVATPIESVGALFRTYRLLGPRDQPGELLVERTGDGLGLTIRLGRFGEPELEAAVLETIRRQLRDAG